MDSNILNSEELQRFLVDISLKKEKGTLELKNTYLIKQLNYQDGFFTSWETSNRNRQMGNIGFCLLQQGFVSCNDLYAAFLDQVQLRKHYCEILMERGMLSYENLQIATQQVIFEELAEVCAWENGSFRSLNKKLAQSSMYGNPYLQTMLIKTKIENVTAQISNYLSNWNDLKEKLDNFNIIIYINENCQNELYEYLYENYMLYEFEFKKNINKIFVNSIAHRIQKNISFFNKKLTLREIIPLLTTDPLSFCNLVLDLLQHNYLLKMSTEQIIDLAENSQKEKNTPDTKKFYGILLQSKEVKEKDKNNIKSALYQLEKKTSGRIQSHNMNILNTKFPDVDSKFPGYEILEELGRGAMGTVYKARQKSLNRYVAIKVVRPSLAIDEIYIKRLELEAKTMAKLRHPSIVSAIDFRFQKDICYIVMEYISGGLTLLDLIEKHEKIDEKEALRIGLSIANALKYLYQNHLVHRDIKPSNILLDKDQVAKLADLGLIKDTKINSEITLPGSTVGTPAYMSPEQLQMDNDIDIRSDIYSLGATLFCAVTGKSRFNNSIPAGVIYHKIISQGNSCVKKEKDLSAGLKNVLCKMLDPEKKKRYQTPDELIEDLERTIIGKPTLFAKKSYNILLYFVFLCGLLALIFSGNYIYSRQKILVDNSIKTSNNNTSNDNMIKIIKKPVNEISSENNQNILNLKNDEDKEKEKINKSNTIKNISPFEKISEIYKNNRYQEVINEVEKLDPYEVSPEIVLIKGHAYTHLLKYKDAKDHFRETQIDYPEESFMGLALISYLQKDVNIALKYLKKIKKVRNLEAPSKFYYLRSRIYFYLKNTKKSRRDLELILKRIPDFWQAHYLLSFLWKDNQPALALESLNIAFENGGENESVTLLAWLHYYKGVLLYHLKNNAEAEKILLHSYKEIASKEVLCYLAILCSKKRQEKKAITFFTESLSTQKTLEDYSFQYIDTFPLRSYFFSTEKIHYERGKLFEKLKNYKLALEDFKNAIKINTKYMPALQRSFSLHMKQENKKEALLLASIILDLQPNNNKLYWKKAQLNFQLQNYKEASQDFSLLLKRSYHKKESLRRRAMCYIKLGDKRALLDIEKLLAINPNDLEMAKEKVRFYKNGQNTTEITAAYKKLFDLNPNNSEVYRELISIYLGQKNYSYLISIYEKYLFFKPNDLETLYGVSRCYIKLENYSKSIFYLEKVKNIDPTYLETLFFLGFSYYSLDRPQEALLVLSNAINNNTKNKEAYYLRGSIYYKRSMYRKTIIDLAMYIKYFPQNMEALSLRAYSYKAIELYRRALKDYQTLIIISPSNYKSLIYKGECETKLGLYKNAINSFYNAEKITILDADSYNYRGYCYAQLGKMNQAIADYRKVININPNHILARTNYAITLYATKKYNAALKEITIVINFDQTNIKAFESRGKIYLKLKKYKQATKDFSAVISKEKENAYAYYYLALSLYKFNKLEEAEKYFKQALRKKIGKKAILARKYLRVIKVMIDRKK